MIEKPVQWFTNEDGVSVSKANSDWAVADDNQVAFPEGRWRPTIRFCFWQIEALPQTLNK